MAKHLVTRSWPITQGLPLALHKLTEGIVSTDLLVAYTPFFFLFFFAPKILGQKEWGPRHKPGLNQLKKWPEAARVTLPLQDFRKNTELLICGLTTEWIFRKCPKSRVCTYHNMDFRRTFYALERRTSHSSE